MLGLAFTAWLTVVICYGGNWVLGQCMIERPIVVGLIAGILMGDVQTGVIIGASLEAIFMGAVNIGGAISAEPVTATVLAVAFAVGAGVDTSAAITIAVPVGVVTAFLSIFMNNVVLAFFAGPFDKMAADGTSVGLRSSTIFFGSSSMPCSHLSRSLVSTLVQSRLPLSSTRFLPTLLQALMQLVPYFLLLVWHFCCRCFGARSSRSISSWALPCIPISSSQ